MPVIPLAYFMQEIFFSPCAPDHIGGRSLSPQPLTRENDRAIVIRSRAVVSHHGALATD
jgi:hypothetical protein